MCLVVLVSGLANGPLFKTFTYRQVSMTGAIFVFISLLLTTFSYNFITYLVSFSILYGKILNKFWFQFNVENKLKNSIVICIFPGASYGISSSANALALNTYWKNRRRLATGLSWTTTGLGPILWPHIITALFAAFGETGAILIISGISLHALACALLLQPVEWHTKQPHEKNEDQEKLLKADTKDKDIEKKPESGYFSQVSKFKNLSTFSSQYLYNEDDPVNPGYEITDPGIPMMLRANDGYFSKSRQSKSRLSSREGSNKNSQMNSRLNSKKPSMTNLLENRSRKSSTLYLNESKKNSSANLGALVPQERDRSRKSSTLYLNESKKNSYGNLLTVTQDRDRDRSRKSSTLYLNESKKNSSANLGAMAQERDTYKPKRKTSITLETQIPESEIEDCPTLKAPQDLKADEKAVVEKIDPADAKDIADRAEKHFVGSKSIKSFKMDGQYGEKYNKDNHSNVSLKMQKESEENEEKKYLKDNHSNQSFRTRHRRKSNNFNYESEVLKQASLKLEQYLKESEDKTEKMKLLMTQMEENDNDDDDNVFEEKKKDVVEEEEEEEENLTFCQKVSLFFDLDLLKDYTFINLMLGITLANFNELNFSILTPFILGDYGKTKSEVALFMSLLAGVDICVRFCIPFVAGKIGWDNNSFFLFGVMTMAMGRVGNKIIILFCKLF